MGIIRNIVVVFGFSMVANSITTSSTSTGFIFGIMAYGVINILDAIFDEKY